MFLSIIFNTQSKLIQPVKFHTTLTNTVSLYFVSIFLNAKQNAIVIKRSD